MDRQRALNKEGLGLFLVIEAFSCIAMISIRIYRIKFKLYLQPGFYNHISFLLFLNQLYAKDWQVFGTSYNYAFVVKHATHNVY